MQRDARKAALAAYKERKIEAGIYAVRCAGSERAWVGWTTNLEKIRNRHWFLLRLGDHRLPELQQAWNATGGDDFGFEFLERLDDDVPAVIRKSRLQERAEHWRERLGAASI